MTRPPRRPFQGVHLLLTGLRQLKSTGLNSCVLVPLLLNTGLYILMIWAAFHTFGRLVDQWLGWLPGWLAPLSFLLWPLFVLILGCALLLTFTLTAHLIAAPFYGFLAEKVQRQLAPDSLPDEGQEPGITRIILRSLSREMQKIAYVLPRLLVLALVSFVPVVNLITPWLWLAFSAWTTAIQYCDYAADNEGVSFGDMKRQLASPLWPSWLFGVSVSLSTLIPFAGLLVMPAAVIGGTHLWVERRHQAAGKARI